MVFSSLLFATIFLPLCLASYFGLPLLLHKENEEKIKLQNIILLVFSLIFYATCGIKYLLLIFAVMFLNWGGGFLCLPRRHPDGERKRSLILIIAADLGLLFFFKYFNLFVAVIENIFFAGNLTGAERLNGILTGTGTGNSGIIQVVLPVGISFFTFQALSYVIDIYRGVVELQPSFFNFALYIACFPQLIAGPIVQYKDVCAQIKDRSVDADKFTEGIRRFCYGFAKKVLIANSMASVADSVWASNISNMDALCAWLGALAYTFEIYYDFSGYSDMAIGLGKMLGFDFKENFNYPYQAESVQDFWRRWHISLSSWFRDYVYFPLGGSRCSLQKTCRNVFIVFLLTGIWHGANWTFMVWGLVYGILLIIERVWTGKYLKANPIKFLNRILTFLIANFLWVVFRADNIVDACKFISRMFVGGFSVQNIFIHLSGFNCIALVLAFLFAGFLQRFFKPKFVTEGRIIPLLLLLVSIIFLVNGTYNPFIYYQF